MDTSLDRVQMREEEESMQINFTRLSQEQTERYKREGRCFRCLALGHMSWQCPNKGRNNYKGKQKGKPSKMIRATIPEDEGTDKEEGSSNGNQNRLMQIRALLNELDQERPGRDPSQQGF